MSYEYGVLIFVSIAVLAFVLIGCICDEARNSEKENEEDERNRRTQGEMIEHGLVYCLLSRKYYACTAIVIDHSGYIVNNSFTYKSDLMLELLF